MTRTDGWPEAVVDACERWSCRVRARPVAPEPGEAATPTALGPPRALSTVVEDVEGRIHSGTTHATHPRHFGLFVPTVCPAAVVADTLAAQYNLQLGTRFYAPAAAAIEATTLQHLGAKLGFDCAEATFTSGGSEANLCGVLAALGRAFPNWPSDGVAAAAPTATVYLSEAAHDSFAKIVRTVGLGTRALRRVAVDERRRMRVDVLRRMVANDRSRGGAPFAVIATVGTTADGAIDPVDEIVAFARREGLWVHADAAWGAMAVLSPTLAPHVAGLAGVDSVTWDAHKTLPVAAGAGMFFSPHRGCLAPAFDVRTPYVPVVDDEPEPYQRTPQWSRRCIGLKVYVTLATYGDEGIARMIEHQARMGRQLRAAVAEAGYAVANDSPLPVVTFGDPTLSPDSTRRWARAVVDSGEAWVSPVTRADGAVVLRACITHHQTDAADIDALVETLQRWRP